MLVYNVIFLSIPTFIISYFSQDLFYDELRLSNWVIWSFGCFFFQSTDKFQIRYKNTHYSFKQSETSKCSHILTESLPNCEL